MAAGERRVQPVLALQHRLRAGEAGAREERGDDARVTTPASLFPVGRPFYAALFPISGLALLGFGIGGKKSRGRRVLLTLLLGGFFSLIVFQAGCGSSSSTSTTTGTPAGTYNLTVTATSGNATRTQQIVLVVQ